MIFVSDFIRIHSPVLALKCAGKGYLPYTHIIQRTCISKTGYSSIPKTHVFQNIIVLIFKLHVKLNWIVVKCLKIIIVTDATFVDSCQTALAWMLSCAGTELPQEEACPGQLCEEANFCPWQYSVFTNPHRRSQVQCWGKKEHAEAVPNCVMWLLMLHECLIAGSGGLQAWGSST